ncbi:MAG: SbcC/MukB-like Walker B domain-containing protein, partial [Verrucomicrobiota bacterium]
ETGIKGLDGEERETASDLKVNDRERNLADGILQERTDLRAVEVDALNVLVEHRIFEEADPELQPDNIDLRANPAVDLARRTEQRFTDIPLDERSLKNAENRFQTEFSTLRDQLGMSGYNPQLETVDGGARKVTCRFQNEDRTMREMRTLLHEEVEQREQYLDAREREVIENHLIGEIASELQELIRQGEDWKRDVTEELDRRPSSSGIKLKFNWEADPEGPAGLPEARRQLLRASTVWSPAERDAIGNFLHDRIRTVQRENEGGSWQDHLTKALDYRSWHRFQVERFQDGQWKKLTKKTYGTGSGGEKAIALTVPQFAAAAAHYQSASKLAPRLILLDEVFVGIDSPTRAELMGLLGSFDLDFVMTSEREWGCYQTLPDVAIYQLSSRPENPAVFVSRWVWNGRQRVDDE